jgi:hypothetical protein
MPDALCKNLRKQRNAMRAKQTSKNDLILPSPILETGNTNQLRVVREKMEALRITEKDVQEAVTWSRKRK